MTKAPNNVYQLKCVPKLSIDENLTLVTLKTIVGNDCKVETPIKSKQQLPKTMEKGSKQLTTEHLPCKFKAFYIVITISYLLFIMNNLSRVLYLFVFACVENRKLYHHNFGLVFSCFKQSCTNNLVRRDDKRRLMTTDDKISKKLTKNWFSLINLQYFIVLYMLWKLFCSTVLFNARTLLIFPILNTPYLYKRRRKKWGLLHHFLFYCDFLFLCFRDFLT